MIMDYKIISLNKRQTEKFDDFLNKFSRQINKQLKDDWILHGNHTISSIDFSTSYSSSNGGLRELTPSLSITQALVKLKD